MGSAAFVGVFSAQELGSRNFIWIEAEGAKTVTFPFQVVALDGASQGSGIDSKEDEGSTGIAKYEFYVATEGTYTLWARCFWPNVCSNMIRYAIDNSAVRQLGENPIVNQWHWLSSVSVPLTKGMHALTLWPGEPESRVDKFLIAGNSSFIPTDMGDSFDKYFDFQGDRGDRLTGISFDDSTRWNVVRDGSSELCLYAKPVVAGGLAQAQIDIIPMLDYTSQFIYRPRSLPYHLEFVFEWQDQDNYNTITWEGDSWYLYSVQRKKRLEIARGSQQGLLVSSDYNLVSLNRSGKAFTIKFNGRSIFQDELTHYASAMRFKSLTGDIFLDNITTYAGSKFNSLTENFHFTFASLSVVKPENTSNYFSNLTKGKVSWWSILGDWRLVQDGFEVVEGKSIHGGEQALLVLGNDNFMTNYNFAVSTRANAFGNLGICFFFQDKDNYYLFKWKSVTRDIGYYELIKRVDGLEYTLSSKLVPPLLPGYHRWSTINLTASPGAIRIEVDGRSAAATMDSTFREGKVGLWTDMPQGASFDDISVSPLVDDGVGTARQSPLVYELWPKYSDISADFSNWLLGNGSVLKMQPLLHETGWYEYFNYLYKPLFETVSLIYRRRISDQFEMVIQNSEIGPDVNINYYFTAYTQGSIVPYFIEVRDSLLTLSRDDIVLKSLKIPVAGGRESSVLSRRENLWSVKIDDADSIVVSDALKIDSLNFSVGYSGFGVDEIFLGKIVIDQKTH